MTTALRTAVAALLLIPFFVAPVIADDHGRRGEGRERGRPGSDRDNQWHGDIRQFRGHDEDRWRGGNGYHGRHDSRLGWWWIVGGLWYFYPNRVEPYPDPYQPPVVMVPAPPEPTQYWYYCANPAGYYPYVARCVVNWQRVPATVPLQ